MEVVETSLFGIPLLQVIGEVDHWTASELDEEIQKACGADGYRLLLDLSQCPYLDSGGIGVILMTLRRVRTRGWLGVIGCNRDLSRLFAISGLLNDPDLRVFASSREASTALAAANEGT